MSAVAALALTLALAPAPTPSASGGPVGDLLGDVGKIVDDLLTGGGRATPSVSPTPAAPNPTAATPSPAGSSAVPSPEASASVPGQGRPTGRPGDREAAVPDPNGRGAASGVPSVLGAPPPNDDGEGTDRWLVTGLALGALAVPVLLVWSRRRRPAAVPTGPASVSAPAPTLASAPDEGPAVDNVTRLPTNLNAIYELGRLDERLSQERDRRP